MKFTSIFYPTSADNLRFLQQRIGILKQMMGGERVSRSLALFLPLFIIMFLVNLKILQKNSIFAAKCLYLWKKNFFDTK